MPIPPPPTRPPARGLTRAILYVSGLVLLGMAYIGVVTPGIPTTPWLLAASYCFARTSPRLQRWIWYSPGFGPLVRDFTLHRGMRPRSKRVAVPMIVLACSFSILFAPLPDWVRVLIAICGCVGVGVVLFVVPTVRKDD